ncbi:MAG: flagellar hook-basal body protein [SAR324 cluster bacterium]|nr:flagellar hook-basal body protein [SAR324 cluster bacterium]
MNPQGIYTLVSQGNALDRQMETIANNLANLNTIGYKEDQLAFQQLFATTMGVASESDEELFAHHEHLAPYTGVGTFFVSVADMGTNHSPGPLLQTGKKLDFALLNETEYFSIQTPQGERFTRGGNFTINQDGTLVTHEGYPVNGKPVDGKDATLNLKGNDVRLGGDGTVTVDGKEAGGFKIVTFRFPHRLQKFGGAMFAPNDPENLPKIKEEPSLAQGMLESSNVNAVKELVRMIQANRAYTSMQKGITAADDMNRSALTLAEA